MNYIDVATQVLELLGGKNNVLSNATCMTRLRVGIKDYSLIKVDEIKKIEGVLGVVEADTIQIVFGPGTVTKVGDEFSKLTNINIGSTSDDVDVNDLAAVNKEKSKAKHDGPLQGFLRKIAAVFVPLLPGIIAAGLINGITNAINAGTGGSLSGEWWYESIRTIGWTIFAYLPIFVGMNAAKEMKGTPILGAVAGALAVTNPAMPLLSLFGPDKTEPVIIPFTDAVFNPAAGGILAALLAGFVFAIIERNIRKVMPNVLDTFFTPLLTILIGGFLMIVILQPVGATLTNVIFDTLLFVYDNFGVFGGYILSSTFLPLVSVGLHQALIPIHVMLNDPEGATNGINFLLPILMMAGGGQVGAAIALLVKTKNSNIKKLIKNSLPLGFLGIGEPLMYAITLPLGRSFLTACIGAGFGGVAAVLFNLGAISQGVSGLFGIFIIEPGQQFAYLICLSIAYMGGFTVTYFFGVDETRINELYGE